LIPTVAWKAVYNDYVIAYPKSPFHEDTLKDLLRDALKDFKTGNCNEKGTEKVVLQFDGVLTQLKALDDHSMRNVLKLKQDFINGRLGTIGVGPSFPSSIKANCPSPTLGPNNPPSSSIGPFKGSMTKQEMLQFQSRNFITMASCFQVSSEICDALLATKMDINHRKNKVKISNLKVA